MIKHFFKKGIFLGVLLALYIGMIVQAKTCAVYKVESGDNIWDIAKNFQADFKETLGFNTHFDDPDLIYPGDTVYVPVDAVEMDETEITEKEEAGQNQDSEKEETQENNNGEAEVPETEKEQNNNSNSEQETEKGNDTAENNGSELSSHASMERDVFHLVNEERIKAGVEPLELSSDLTNVARVKSKDMIDNKYFAHTSPNYGSPSEMISSFGISYTVSGENIAYGQKTAASVMNTWMNSSGHRANILDSRFTHIGIGCVEAGDGTIYWTQMFIK